MTSKKRQCVAVFVHDERVWALPTWWKTIPEIYRDHDIAGIWLFPDRLDRRLGMSSAAWYLRVFGTWSCFLLALFAMRTRIAALRHGRISWSALARKYGSKICHGDSPNADSVRRWLIEQNVDVVFSMVSDILKPELLDTPRLGVVSKHASLLPSCRGVYPFLWARLNELPLGISFHRVVAKIDAGPLLVQESIDCPAGTSMLRFYADVFARYPALACLALNRLVAGENMEPLPGTVPSYFGFPTRADVRAFTGKGYRIARVSDVFH